jgi:hypothetical protein
VRSCVNAGMDRKPMREVGTLGRTRSDCILLFDMVDLFLARLSLRAIRGTKASALA